VKVIDAKMGMRLSEENEVQGMDYSEYAETAYN
jgi:ammonia channel protein AmtB